ncbi:hypothetical protein BCR44DRAFT_1195263 [Catenaria anguillulae PL171]|uniref:Uncharacterized protein n=1 Tax=Catenaria anguillulae PL171 TaxID=765915 RepID=A0A1Y2HGD7_9FUNG|nr:hypothetical protein BCR44DRAFT_1195263 [Catenaria anguillulae PL171]
MLSPTDITGLRQLTDLGNPAATTDGTAASTGPKSISIDQYEVEHLDYGYVRTCTDVNELHVLLAVLRSGKEGLYPELETFIEGRIQSLGGKILGSRHAPAANAPADVRNDVTDDLNNWLKTLPSTAKPAPISSHDLGSSADSSTEPTTDSVEQELLIESANQSNLKGHEALRSHDYAEAIDHTERP